MKQGDLVKLKSGGPVMTIEAVSEERAYCTWFKDDAMERAYFNLSMLEPSDKVSEEDAALAAAIKGADAAAEASLQNINRKNDQYTVTLTPLAAKAPI